MRKCKAEEQPLLKEEQKKTAKVVGRLKDMMQPKDYGINTRANTQGHLLFRFLLAAQPPH